jgi:hypothetical protein
MPIEDIESELRQVAESLVLADLAYRKGKIAEAEPMYERSLAMLIRTYAEAHPDVDACLLRLGDIYFARDKFAQALSTYSRLHGLRSRVLSHHHLDTIAVSFKIAKSQEKLSRIDEAARTYEEAIALGEQWLPPGHPLVGSMMESYAILLRKGKNDSQRATEIEQQAKEYRKKYKGPKVTSLNPPSIASSPAFTPASPEAIDRALTTSHLREATSSSTLEPSDPEQKKPSSMNFLLIAFIVLVALIVPAFIGWTMMHQRARTEVNQQMSRPASLGATTTTMPPDAAIHQDQAPSRIEQTPGSIQQMPARIEQTPGRFEQTPASEQTPTRIDPSAGTSIVVPPNLRAPTARERPPEPPSPLKPPPRHVVDKPSSHPKAKTPQPAPMPVSGVWSDIYRSREKYTH